MKGMIQNNRLGKIQRFARGWSQGRSSHFPICCVLRFAIEDALQDGKTTPFSQGFAVRRGTTDRGDGNIFVPCNVFHHKTEDFWGDA